MWFVRFRFDGNFFGMDGVSNGGHNGVNLTGDKKFQVLNPLLFILLYWRICQETLRLAGAVWHIMELLLEKLKLMKWKNDMVKLDCITKFGVETKFW